MSLHTESLRSILGSVSRFRVGRAPVVVFGWRMVARVSAVAPAPAVIADDSGARRRFVFMLRKLKTELDV